MTRHARPTPTHLAALALAAGLLASLPAAAQVPAPAPGRASGNLPLQDRDQACAQLWRDYQRSQACYNRFRVVGGGLRQEAYASCGQPLPDPSAQCGPPVLPR